MNDIFICYSSRDRKQALLLCEELRSRGISVWVDQHAIDGAEKWSNEIAKALDECKALIFLVSRTSLASRNCVKEVTIADEADKYILPVDLEDVSFPTEFKYHLAGLQRVAFENREGIWRAMEKLLPGFSPETKNILPQKSEDTSVRLAVLPFDDLSPNHDNEWFADGLTDDLITTLNKLDRIFVLDRLSSREYKNSKLNSKQIAREVGVRFIVTGAVRKQDKNIRVQATLIDTKTGKTLWDEKFSGTMDDIFAIQEQTAKDIADGLKLKLTFEEVSEIEKKATKNAEAYELHLKGREYYNRYTKADYEKALSLYEEAVRIDPNYAAVYADIAQTCQEIYRNYSRTSEWLDKAEAAVEKVKEIEGETAQYFRELSNIALRRGNAEEALNFAKRSVESDPNFAPGYDALGFAYKAIGNLPEAVGAWEQDVRLRENNSMAHFNLLNALDMLGDKERLRNAAERAIPIFERHNRLNPDDYFMRVSLANILLWAEKKATAIAMADSLAEIESLDGVAFYNLAYLYVACDEPLQAIEMLRRSVVKGFKGIEEYLQSPEWDVLRGKTEFQLLAEHK